MAKKTYVVKHGNFNTMVEGKLTRLDIGTEIEMDEKQAEKAGSKLAPKQEPKKVKARAE